MSAVWIAVIAISLLGLIFGLILGYASRRFAVQDDPVVEKIDELLPQSQCGQCGYPVAPMRKRSAPRVRKLTAARRVAKR
jgi:electron transport complex protein RnfB